MKLLIAQIFFLIILIITFNKGYAEQLIHITFENKINSYEQLFQYSKPIFYEDRFALVLEEDDWQKSEKNQQLLTHFKEDYYYFILYPIRESYTHDLASFGNVLKLEPEYIIFETEHQFLNDFSVFHNFQLVKIHDRAIIPIPKKLLPTSDEMLLFNPAIQTMVDNVDADTIWNYIANLQSMERYTTNSSAIYSSNYLKNHFHSLGFDTVYFHHWQSGSIPNVVAVKYGKQFPDEIYLVGGHYDTYTNGAPGADDNGSGTASIMEMGRVMSSMYFKRTLKYVLFSGEELGLFGSAAYASQAVSQGENILGMINMDMIAYVQPGDQIDVDVLKNTASQDLFDAYSQATQNYVPNLPIVNGSLPFGASSDHASFWSNGFKAIFPFEDSYDYSPYIHTSQDILGTSANNQILAELGTKSVVATLATLAEIAEARITGHVFSAENLQPIADALIYFNGDSVSTNASGNFTTPPLTPDTYQIIFTAAGFESDTIVHNINQYEIFEVDVNLIPAGSMRPFVHISGITIDDDSSGSSLGNNNGIADAGETVEISANFINTGSIDAYDISGAVQVSNFWITVLQDSFFIDTVKTSGTYSSNNNIVVTVHPETPANTKILFPVSLNYQGFQNVSNFTLNIHNRGDVLIVQDDDNGGGLSAYTTSLDCLKISYDVGSSDILQQEMNEYKYIFWFCGEDYTNTLTFSDKQKLTSYLDNGGKLFINGVDIGYDIHNEPFYTTYLKANYNGDGPYSTIYTVYGAAADPIAGDFTTGLNIEDNYIDQITPVGGAEQIFDYNYNSGNFGCGLKYKGTYQLVYLTFTFENIQNTDHRLTILNNIWNWFGGNVSNLSQDAKPVDRFYLAQNYPNPFNPTTTIQFSVPKNEFVSLKIYNLLGQVVTTIVAEKLNPGEYKYIWDASNFASGVYIYKMHTSGGFTMSKKLVVIK